MNGRDLRKELEKRKRLVTGKGYTYVCLSLQGSQNYMLETEDSDIDVKAYVAPSLREILLNKKPVTTTHEITKEEIAYGEENEHIDIKDIRLWKNLVMKANPNWIENFFTKHIIINPDFKKEYGNFSKAAVRLIDSRTTFLAKAITGMAFNKYHALEKNYPSKEKEMLAYGYDPKQLHHIVRLEFVMKKLLCGSKFKDTLVLEKETRDYLVSLKTEPIKLEDARILSAASLSAIEKMRDEIVDRGEPKDEEAMANYIDSYIKLAEKCVSSASSADAQQDRVEAV